MQGSMLEIEVGVAIFEAGIGQAHLPKWILQKGNSLKQYKWENLSKGTRGEGFLRGNFRNLVW